jgi:hypothetical protein
VNAASCIIKDWLSCRSRISSRSGGCLCSQGWSGTKAFYGMAAGSNELVDSDLGVMVRPGWVEVSNGLAVISGGGRTTPLNL